MSEITERLKVAIADRYLIERELGQGGMATVYLAHDAKHDRKVALKVLRPELAAVIGAERFLQEIKVTANLQHSHILPLYDSGAAEGFLYYVMPYVEGETLRTKLAKEKQLGVDEAITLTRAVAGALEHAHKQGVIHRDIKPENILLRDGDPLIADFGIALAVSHAGGNRLTETGLSIGTPHYMSPEQAMGDRELDARSDVYSLAAMLYEMLTGDPPYTGSTAQAIVAKVLTEKAPWVTSLRDTVPEHVSATIAKALAKLPADRFHSAAQFADALVAPGPVVVPGTRVAPASVVPARARLVGRAGWVVAAGLALVAGWLALRPAHPAPVQRYGLALPASQTPEEGFPVLPSPDGSRIVYVGPSSEGVQLWVKARDQYEATPLPGTVGVTNFTWSPDGQWIAFSLAGQLMKIPIVGGAAIPLADTASGNPGIAWLDDGTIVYLQTGGTVLRRVPSTGGPSAVAFDAQAQVRWPSPLPDGHGILFTRCVSMPSCDIWQLDLGTGKAHSVLAGGVLGLFAPTGHLVYVRRDGAAFAVPFDVGSGSVSGSAIPVLDSVLVVNDIYPVLGVSPSGTLVMQRGAALSLLQRYQMIWVDPQGHETPLDTTWTLRFISFGGNAGWALSPDGSRLAIGLATEAGDDIWVKQLPHGAVSRVSYDSAAEYRPRWMPDGRRVMFESNRPGEGAGGLYVRAANGTGADSLIRRATGGVYEGAWSPDAKWLVFRTGGTLGQVGGRDIVGIRPGVDSAPVPVVVTPYDEEAIAISPDGRWLAYESNETGRTEVFLRSFPKTDAGKWQVSNGGGVAPLWAKNGRQLFYVSGNRDMMAVTVAAGADPQLGESRVLFHMRDEWYLQDREFYTPYDVAPDGRFLMARSITPGSSAQAVLIVVDNWFSELRARVTGGR
jgi:Tol biopolymer transport system component/tRNA A-37 threonylcarbamoyl transferase component Bud32